MILLRLIAAFTMIAMGSGGAFAAEPFVWQADEKYASISLNIPGGLRSEKKLFDAVVAEQKEKAAEFIKSAKAEYDEPGTDKANWNPYGLVTQYLPQYEDANFLSYLVAVSDYSGGAHPNTYYSVLNYDRRSGRRLVLEDILEKAENGGEALQALSTFARADLKRQQGADASAEFINPGTEPKEEIYGVFTLVPSTAPGKFGGLAFHFPPYAVGAYAQGDFHVVAAPKIFAKFLKPGLAERFGGAPKPQSHEMTPQ